MVFFHFPLIAEKQGRPISSWPMVVGTLLVCCKYFSSIELHKIPNIPCWFHLLIFVHFRFDSEHRFADQRFSKSSSPSESPRCNEHHLIDIPTSTQQLQQNNPLKFIARRRALLQLRIFFRQINTPHDAVEDSCING